MSTFSLDHINDTAFEEFCFDLLGELKFVNIKWRKGTGLSASPADRGRDIECERVITDLADGSVHIEKWFVQCKHYKQGVPPEKIHSALSWASSARVDWLLIIVSNFLSNPAKDFVEDFKRNQNPHLKVKIWEKPDLEKLTASKISLLKKHSVPSSVSFISIMHPAHLMYIRKTPLNTLNYFFEVVDNIDAVKRDSALGWVYKLVIQPRRRDPITGDEKMRDLYIDEVSYNVFKSKCYRLAERVHEMLLVHALASLSLSLTFSIADKTNVYEKIEEMQRTVEFWQSVLGKSEEEISELEDLFDEGSNVILRGIFRNSDSITRNTEFTRKMIEELPARTEDNYLLYNYYCEHVIDKLLQERVM